jgi:hypothetical protein
MRLITDPRMLKASVKHAENRGLTSGLVFNFRDTMLMANSRKHRGRQRLLRLEAARACFQEQTESGCRSAAFIPGMLELASSFVDGSETQACL